MTPTKHKGFFGIFGSKSPPETPAPKHEAVGGDPIGLIAGNGSFPLRFIEEAHKNGRLVCGVCHVGETLPETAEALDAAAWVKLGELGKMISFFKDKGVAQAAMAGGIDRVKHFGAVKLDTRGAALLLKIRSTKDDIIMRGIADELLHEGIEVVPSTIYLQESLVKPGVLTNSGPSEAEAADIQVGLEAIKAMSSQHIGQVVVVREGTVVAVEAVEGTNAAILRGGELGGAGTVVVKFAKPEQDMRFDVPTVGIKTVETMSQAKARVLALEAGRTLIMDERDTIALANRRHISVIGCEPLTV